MAEAVYILCAVTGVACAALLYRGYARTGARLLLWSAICFAALAANNALLYVDKVLLPSTIDLRVWRSVAALFGVLVLLYGLIWDAE